MCRKRASATESMLWINWLNSWNSLSLRDQWPSPAEWRASSWLPRGSSPSRSRGRRRSWWLVCPTWGQPCWWAACPCPLSCTGSSRTSRYAAGAAWVRLPSCDPPQPPRLICSVHCGRQSRCIGLYNVGLCRESVHVQLNGRCCSGGRAVVWQSEGCRFDSTLGVSKCPWARHLTPNCSWRAGWYLAWQPIAVGVWMCVWMGEWEAKIVKRFG